tara:strand:+ start:62 stop:751 length:690 start_codon:yes stop_codon:yes gene_type:complete
MREQEIKINLPTLWLEALLREIVIEALKMESPTQVARHMVEVWRARKRPLHPAHRVPSDAVRNQMVNWIRTCTVGRNMMVVVAKRAREEGWNAELQGFEFEDYLDSDCVAVRIADYVEEVLEHIHVNQFGLHFCGPQSPEKNELIDERKEKMQEQTKRISIMVEGKGEVPLLAAPEQVTVFYRLAEGQWLQDPTSKHHLMGGVVEVVRHADGGLDVTLLGSARRKKSPI